MVCIISTYIQLHQYSEDKNHKFKKSECIEMYLTDNHIL